MPARPPTLPLPLRLTSLLLAFAVSALAVLAVAPQWHEHLHEDAPHPEHQCGVTLFAHGVEAGGTPSACPHPLPAAPVGSTWVCREGIPLAPAHALPPPCGPPAFRQR